MLHFVEAYVIIDTYENEFIKNKKGGLYLTNNQLGAKIKSLRDRDDKSIQEIADYLGVNKSTVSRWESGDTTKIKHEYIFKLATFFRESVDYFFDTKDDLSSLKTDYFEPYEVRNSGLNIPLGNVSAGLPKLMDSSYDEAFSKENFSKKNDEYFYLRINGNSMNRKGLVNGSLVCVRKQSTAENGNIVVVRVNGDEATIKRFRREGDIVYLIPESYDPDYHTQVYDLKETSIDIIGVAKDVVISLD